MTNELTREEVLARATELGWEPSEADRPGAFEGNRDRELASALWALSLDGTWDEQSGDTESPTGHFTRIGRWVVQCDQQGFVNLDERITVAEACELFETFEREYDAWLGDE
jgi:hypothetical protein